MTLDDIDWRAGTLMIHGKGSREQLPLPVDVDSALSSHLEDGSPAWAWGRAVFIRARAPYWVLDRKSTSTMVGFMSSEG